MAFMSIRFRKATALAITTAGLVCASSLLAHTTSGVETDEVDSNYYKVWCKAYITEQGRATSVVVLRVEPHTKSDARIGESVRKAVLTWHFKPETKNGKAIAGYRTFPVDVN
jgi:hypothetical protein